MIGIRSGRAGGGTGTMFVCDGQTYSHDTFTCAHCNRVIVINYGRDVPRQWGRVPQTHQDADGHCKLCDQRICGPCMDPKVGCMPYLKKLELMERAVRRSESQSEFFRGIEECLK